MSISDLAYASLEQALNQHIAMDPRAKAEMAALHGRVIGLQILGTGQTIFLAPGPEMIQLFGTYEGEPDCLLQGSPMTIAALRTQIPQGSSPLPEEMQVSGDPELAEQFCRILRQVNIDWEAHLSKYTGTLIAGEIGKIIDFTGYWQEHIVNTLKQELQEQMHNDTSVLPSTNEIEKFGADVELLAEQLNKLEQRINTILNNKNS